MKQKGLEGVKKQLCSKQQEFFIKTHSYALYSCSSTDAIRIL